MVNKRHILCPPRDYSFWLINIPHVLKIQNTYIFVKFKHIPSYQQSNDFKIGKSQFKQMIRTDKTNTNMTLINVETFVLKYKSQVSRKKNTLPNNPNVMGIMLENVQNTY